MEKAIAKTNKRYFLAFILSALFLCAVSFFFEGKSFDGHTTDHFFTNYEFLFSALALLTLNITIFIFARRSFGIKMCWWLFGFCLFFFITSSIAAIFYQGVKYEGQLIGQIDAVDKIRLVLQAFLLFFSLYEIIAIIPKFLSGRRAIRLIFFVGVIVGFVSTIYSFVHENSFYVSFFDGSLVLDGYSVPKSYTTNRNVYAFVLFFALAGEGFLEIERPHWWRWFIMLYFYVQQFFLLSKTCLLISSFFCLCIWSYCLYRSFKVRRISEGAFLIVFFCSLLLMLLVFLLAKGNNGPFLFAANYFRFLKTQFISMSKNSILSRIPSIEIPFHAIKENGLFTLIFGFGYGNEYRALGCFSAGNPNYYSIIDNAWGLTLAQGGIMGFVYSRLVWDFGLVLIVKSFLKGYRYSWFSLIVYICLFGRSMMENDNISYLDFAGVCYFSLAYLPLLVEDAMNKVNPLEEPVLEKKKISNPSLFLAKAFAITFLPSLFLIALSRKLGYMFGITYFENLLLRYGGIIFFFVSPVVLGGVLLALNKKKKANGFIAAAIYCLYAISVFVLPIFNTSCLLLIPELAILVADIFILSMGGIYEKKFFSVLTILGNYVVFGIINGITYFFFQKFAHLVTFYGVLATGAVYFALWIYVYFIPREASFISPFENDIAYFENKYAIRRSQKEVTFLEHTNRILEKRLR